LSARVRSWSTRSRFSNSGPLNLPPPVRGWEAAVELPLQPRVAMQQPLQPHSTSRPCAACGPRGNAGGTAGMACGVGQQVHVFPMLGRSTSPPIVLCLSLVLLLYIHTFTIVAAQRALSRPEIGPNWEKGVALARWSVATGQANLVRQSGWQGRQSCYRQRITIPSQKSRFLDQSGRVGRPGFASVGLVKRLTLSRTPDRTDKVTYKTKLNLL
jgi:hypothetical protein